MSAPYLPPSVEQFLDRVARVRPSPWMFPAALALVGTSTVLVSLLFNAAPDEHVELWGRPWPGLCGFLMATGLPCPQCGMTRSWIAMARGQWLTGMRYNPAGATLWLWLVISGLLGWFRLISRRYQALEIPQWALIAWVAIWMIGLYAGGWALRCAFGVNHLAMPHVVEEQLRSRGFNP